MKIEFKVTAYVEHAEGKYASREELTQLAEDAIIDSDPGQIDCEGGGAYEVTVWEVTVV